MALKLRRGLEQNRTSITPADGELIYTTDGKALYVGDGTTPGGNGVSAPVVSVNNKVGAVELKTDDIAERISPTPTNVWFTNERAQDAAAALFTSTTTSSTSHTGITFDYNDTANKVVATVTATGDNFKTISVNIPIFFTFLIPGSGYTRTPTVAVNRAPSDTGNGALAQVDAKLTPAPLASISIVNGGTGYTSPPIISFSGGGDADGGVVHATATCTISGGSINTVNITYAGAGYTGHPTITVTPVGPGGGAILEAFLTQTSVSKLELVDPGNNYRVDPLVVITPDALDATGGGAGATGNLSVPLVASGADLVELRSVAGSPIKFSTYVNPTTQKKILYINSDPVGEVKAGTASNIAFYAGAGNVLSNTRGLFWNAQQSQFQIGSITQGVDGNVRIVRNSYTAATGTGFNFEQYHTTQDTVDFRFIRGRGTQASPQAVINQDKVGDIVFGASNGTGTSFIGQITARVTSSPVGTLFSGALEFYTRDSASTLPAVAVTINGDKTVTLVSSISTTQVTTPTVTTSQSTLTLTATNRVSSSVPFKVPSYTSTSRDALTAQVGDIIYNSTSNKFQGYQNTGGSSLQWVDLS
jgi:hypothetical protein